jgi:glycosyltransferase involved in cell wall biosynthesis
MVETRISIIIPAHNEEEYLPITLEALAKAKAAYRDPRAVEVIVVDNRSDDRTAHIAREHGAKVVHEPQRSIAKARNAGAKASQGKYLLFVDADTIIDKESLNKIEKLFSTKTVLAGGCYMDYDDDWQIKLIARGINHLVARRGRAWGAFFFCERAAFKKVGGFDETLYGTEELALSKALGKEAKIQGRSFHVIQEYLAVTSGRRLKPRLRVLARRVTVLFKLRRAMRDPEICQAIWYDAER